MEKTAPQTAQRGERTGADDAPAWPIDLDVIGRLLCRVAVEEFA
jgi:hypothetical protein